MTDLEEAAIDDLVMKLGDLMRAEIPAPNVSYQALTRVLAYLVAYKDVQDDGDFIDAALDNFAAEYELSKNRIRSELKKRNDLQVGTVH